MSLARDRNCVRGPDRPGLRLTLRGVGKAFGEKPVLDGVDLHAPAGQFLAIVGRSGCGKSTLLRLLAGLDAADAGTDRIRGTVGRAAPSGARHVSGAAAFAMGAGRGQRRFGSARRGRRRGSRTDRRSMRSTLVGFSRPRGRLAVGPVGRAETACRAGASARQRPARSGARRAARRARRPDADRDAAPGRERSGCSAVSPRFWSRTTSPKPSLADRIVLIERGACR